MKKLLLTGIMTVLLLAGSVTSVSAGYGPGNGQGAGRGNGGQGIGLHQQLRDGSCLSESCHWVDGTCRCEGAGECLCGRDCLDENGVCRFDGEPNPLRPQNGTGVRQGGCQGNRVYACLR